MKKFIKKTEQKIEKLIKDGIELKEEEISSLNNILKELKTLGSIQKKDRLPSEMAQALVDNPYVSISGEEATLKLKDIQYSDNTISFWICDPEPDGWIEGRNEDYLSDEATTRMAKFYKSILPEATDVDVGTEYHLADVEVYISL